MFKRLLSLVLILTASPKATDLKYVFFIIGDGMGLAQRTLAEFMLNAKDSDKPGVKSLRMNQFPVQTLAHTYSGDSYITDSAAAGTALARGVKTYHGSVGYSLDKKEIQTSIMKHARRRNMKLGVATTAPMDHATPAAFYAHAQSRYMLYEIGEDFAEAKLNYAGGGCTSHSIQYKLNGRVHPVELAKKAGYTLIQSNEAFFAYEGEDEHVWAMDEHCLKPESDIPYAIEAVPGQLVLKDYVQKGIDILDNPDGFFFLIEGGKIDWACHSNDAATAAREVISTDDAVEVAYQFYLKHPEETLILVTADHETGGLGLGASKTKYSLRPDLLWKQNMSMKSFTWLIPEWKEKKISWDDARDFIVRRFGLDPLSEEEEKLLKIAYSQTMNPEPSAEIPDFMYTKGEPLAITAVKIMDMRAGIGWTTVQHTAVPVPVSVIGQGQEQFRGFLDNTDIYNRLSALLQTPNEE